MGLLQKRIGTEKTGAILYKIFSIAWFIAGLFILFFGGNIESVIPGAGIHFSLITLWFFVLCLWGAIFWFISEFIKIKGEIKNLKDKIKE